MGYFDMPPQETGVPERKETPPTVERRKVESQLETIDGHHADLNVAFVENADGEREARRVNFWDIDNCLLFSHDLYKQYLTELYPAEDPEELDRIFLAGARLGNSFREFHRMQVIYDEGLRQYEDAELYFQDYIADENVRETIDGPGFPGGNHEKAADLVARLGGIAAKKMEEIHNDNPEYFTSEEFLNGPLIHLMEAKKRLGEVNVLMTANPRELAEGISKYAGLSEHCLAVAGDENMIGGGKERQITYLIEQLENMNIPVPQNRLTVVGDSEKGDVGSGWKVAGESGRTFEGILVRPDREGSDQFKEVFADDPELQEMFDGMDVTVVASADVRTVQSDSGKTLYKMGKKGSQQ